MLGNPSLCESPLTLCLPLAGANVIAPITILALCVGAGLATVMLLPSRRPATHRKLGGIALTAMGLILALTILHGSAGADLKGSGPYFWIFAAIAIFGALRVVTHPRPVYSALYFVLTVFASAGLFVLMYAEFMAAALVLIYAGAILVTYVFVIMLAASAQTSEQSPMSGLAEYDVVSREPFAASCIGFAMMGVLLFVIFDKAGEVETVAALPKSTAPFYGSTQALGTYLFTDQLVNLELAGLILTVAMVGAIVIARRRVEDSEGLFEPTGEMISATMTPLNDDPHSIPVYGTEDPSQKAFPET